MASSAVVVGAGVLGSSVADRLARSGWAVTHVEQLAPGHVRSGSGDESRLIRASHGVDAIHTAREGGTNVLQISGTGASGQLGAIVNSNGVVNAPSAPGAGFGAVAAGLEDVYFLNLSRAPRH